METKQSGRELEQDLVKIVLGLWGYTVVFPGPRFLWSNSFLPFFFFFRWRPASYIPRHVLCKVSYRSRVYTANVAI